MGYPYDNQPKFSSGHVTIADWLCAALIFALALLGCAAFGIIETAAYLSWPLPCGLLPFDFLPCF